MAFYPPVLADLKKLIHPTTKLKLQYEPGLLLDAKFALVNANSM